MNEQEKIDLQIEVALEANKFIDDNFDPKSGYDEMSLEQAMAACAVCRKEYADKFFEAHGSFKIIADELPLSFWNDKIEPVIKRPVRGTTKDSIVPLMPYSPVETLAFEALMCKAPGDESLSL